MKKAIFLLSLVVLGLNLYSQTIYSNYIDGHLYFKFKDSHQFNYKVNENTSIDYEQLSNLHYIFNKYGVTQITRPLFIFNDSKLERIIRVEFASINKIEEFIKDLETNSDIEYAEKIPYRKKFITYNDPLYMSINSGGLPYNFKWHLEKINAPTAWDIQQGAASVKVAIVDNAVWGEHPDLQIATANQCSFATGTAVAGSSRPPTSVAQNTACTSTTLQNGNCTAYNWSHGTHCAGLVGARNNNGVGISSIGGGVTLVGVRAANNNDEMYYCDNGVSWAINQGAKVVSMSYGSTTTSQSEISMFQTGVNNGVIFVAAAGNEGDAGNAINYPAGYSTVIGVASINNDGKLSSFSQYGAGRADIAAPGGFVLYNGNEYMPNILSTTYCTSQYLRVFGLSNFDNQYYDGMQGTSMACPIVAGLCGLMASAYPSLTAAQAKSCLQSTATALTAGSNTIDGNGYINARAAVECVQALAGFTVTPTSLSYAATASTNTVTVTAGSSNTSWTGTSNQTWLTLSPATGNGAGAVTTVTLSAIANTTSSSRTAIVTFTHNGQTRTVNVTQQAAGGSSQTCNWLTNITATDIANLNQPGGAYIIGQDRTNSIFNFAERIVNTDALSIDSVSVYVYKKVAANPTTSKINIKIYNEQSNLPGTVLATKEISYSSLTANQENKIKLNSTVNVTGNFYVSIELNSTPTNDSLYILTTGNLNRTAENNTAYVQYNSAWYKTNDLYTGDNFYSFYMYAYACSSSSTPSLSVNPTSLAYTSAAGNKTVNVTSTVAWTVTSNVSWLTVSPSSGSNNGTFTASATANTATVARTATITVSGTGVSPKTIAVTQEAASASLSVNPTSLAYTSAAGNKTVNVTSTVAWTVTSNVSWLTVSPSSGSNNGTFTASATANTATVARTATITVSGTGVSSKTIAVTQEAASASLSVNPTSLAYTSAAGNKTVNVTSTVAWTVTSNVSWLTVSPSSGSNNGTFTASATANTATVARTATITVSGTGVSSKTIAVTQEAASASLSVNPTSLAYTSAAGDKTVNVTSTVAWTVTSNVSWLTVSPSSGSNNGTFTASATANTATVARSATITVSGTGVSSKTIAVTQEAASASLSVNPTSLTYTSAAGDQTVNVTSTVAWTVTSNVSWLTVSPSSGSNNGTFTASATANIATVARTATITVSGTGVSPQTIEVTQEANTSDIVSKSIENTLSVYPNPTSDLLNIKTNFDISNISVLDVLGKVVFDKTVNGQSSVNISVNSYPDGLYIIKVLSSEGKLYYKKFTKK